MIGVYVACLSQPIAIFIRFASSIDKNIEGASKTVAQSYKIVSWNKFSIRVFVKGGGTGFSFFK